MGGSSPESTGEPGSNKRLNSERTSALAAKRPSEPSDSKKSSSNKPGVSHNVSKTDKEDPERPSGSFRIPKKQKPDVGDKGGRSALPNQGPIGDTWQVSRGGGTRGSWKPRGERGRGRGAAFRGAGGAAARKGSPFPLDVLLPQEKPVTPTPCGGGDQAGDQSEERSRSYANRSRGFRNRPPRDFGDRSRGGGRRPHDVADDNSYGGASPASGGDRQSHNGSKCSSATDCSLERRSFLEREFVQVAETNENVNNWLVAIQPHQELILADPNIKERYDEENNAGNEGEPMEVEDVVTEIQQLRGKHTRGSEKVCGDLTLLSKREDPKSSSSPVPPDVTDGAKVDRVAEQVFVVLDTNVLLADLKLVDDIMNSRTGESNIAMSVLLVPWVVMQELDTLKDDKRNLNPNLKKKAEKAVKYLHALLTTCHPQLKGQTAKEAREDVGISIECNDDRILQCCLQYEKVHKNVILFTNDKNLCSKAVINCIRVQSNDGIMPALDRIVPITTTKAVPVPAHEIADLCQVNKNYNTTALQMKTVLRDILGKILETEMIVIFGDIWQSIVLVKPPWRLMDIMKCFQKHWIAVFSEFLGKHAKTQLDIMHQKLKLIGSSHNHENLKVLLGASIHFLACFEKRPAYTLRLSHCISDLRSLLADLKVIKKAKVEKIATIAVEENETVNSSNLQRPTKRNIMDVLNKIWNFINHTSGLLLDSLGMSNPIVYTPPKALATETDCTVFIPKFLPVLMKLKNLMQGVLMLPSGAPSTQPEYANLCYQLENFFHILEMDPDPGHTHLNEHITPHVLWEFYNDDANRELLQRGYLQLEDFCTLIYQCALKIRDKF